MKLSNLATISLIIISAYSLPAFADDKPVTEKLVDTLTALAGGPHEGYRANHAEGIVAEGSFTPSPQAKTISMAGHLQGDATEAIIRFSNATGVPDIDDASSGAFPKGMSIRLALPDEEYTDIVVISVDRFPVSTPEKFLELLTAIKNSGASDQEPKPIEKFLSENPAAKTFVELDKPAPVGFTTQTYYGVNAFQFENEAGETVFGRYIIAPVTGNEFLSTEQREAAGPDYLMKDLPERLAEKEAVFTISLQIAEANDNIIDPTVKWPDERKVIELGQLTIKQIMPDGQSYAQSNMFNPLALPEGITPSNDPILLARSGAYAISFSRRQND